MRKIIYLLLILLPIISFEQTYNNGVIVNAPRAIDLRWGKVSGDLMVPYGSLAEAFAAVDTNYRYQGLEANVIVDGKQCKYWYVGGRQNVNLVPFPVSVPFNSSANFANFTSAQLSASGMMCNIVDQYTGEVFSASPVTTLPDGTAISNSIVDNVIILRNGNTFYSRNYTGGANICWFGAKGNGADNSAPALKAALKSSKNILIPANQNFFLADSISINQSGTTLSGGGTLTMAFLNTDVITIRASNVNISNLTINNSYASVDSNTTYGAGISSIYHDNINITNCNINSNTGILIFGGKNINIVNCNISYSQAGIGVNGAYFLPSMFTHDQPTENVVIENCHVAINNHRWRDMTRGINANDSRNVVIKNCSSFGAQLSFEVGNSLANFRNYNVTIDNCTGDRWMCMNATDFGLVSNCRMDYSLLPANAGPMGTFYNFAVGLEILGCKNSNFSNNFFKGYPKTTIQAGIQDNPYYHDASNSTQNIVFSHNQFLKCGTDNIYYVASMSLCENLIMDYNTFDSCGGAGAIEFAGNNDYPCHNAGISHNYIRNGAGVGIRTYWANNVTINDNVIDKCTSGIDIGHVAWAASVSANRNNITNCTGTGFKVFANGVENSGTENIVKSNAQNWDICNNLSQVFGRFINNDDQPQDIYPPMSGTFYPSDIIPTRLANNPYLKCISKGTQGTLIGVTGSIISGSNVLKLNAATYKITAGQFLIINGVSDIQVKSVSNDTVYLFTNSASSLTASAITYSNASFITLGDRIGVPVLVTDFNQLPTYSTAFFTYLNPQNSPVSGTYFSGMYFQNALNPAYGYALFSDLSGNQYKITKAGGVSGAAVSLSSSGSATLVGGTVTIAANQTTAGSKIIITMNTPSGTIGYLAVPSASITAGTGFIINSYTSAGVLNTADNSTVNWFFH